MKLTRKKLFALIFGSSMGLIVAMLLTTICSPGCQSNHCTDGICPPPNLRPLQPNVASLDPQQWFIFYSEGMSLHPAPSAEGAWSFAFPTLPGQVHYIQTPFNATRTLHSVSLTFRVDSIATQYIVIDPADILPATVHIFFEQQNDNLSEPYGRWWADTSRYNLGSNDNQTITITVPFDANVWSAVEGTTGESAPQAFYAALNNIGWIGITCGGQYFWGHGVALTSGTANYVLVNLQVE
jgi:hypothetical protein